MKTPFFRLFALAIVAAPPVLAADPVSPLVTAQSAPVGQRTDAQLDELLGPIALYPDALIAVILPAATEASNVVLAARFFATQGDPAKVDDQPWDDSVRALAHYPDVVKWMDENLTWTKQLGEAFLAQPAEVMKSVQRLRAAARAAGTLVDTPQQRVVATSEAITIVPAQPDVIYVPSYNPEIVYLPRRDYSYYSTPFLTFGVGYATGFWLGYDLDWSRNRIWVMDRYERERYWRQHHQVPAIVYRPQPRWDNDGIHHVWRPNPNHPRTFQPYSGPPRTVIVRPSPFDHNRRWTPPPAPTRAVPQDLPRPPFDRGGARWGSGANATRPTNGRNEASATVSPPPQVQVAPQAQVPSRPAPNPDRNGRDQRPRDATPGRRPEFFRNTESPAQLNPPVRASTPPAASAPMAAPAPRTGGNFQGSHRGNPAPERAAPPAAAQPAASAPAALPPPPPPAPAARTQEVPAEARQSLYGRGGRS